MNSAYQNRRHNSTSVDSANQSVPCGFGFSNDSSRRSRIDRTDSVTGTLHVVDY
jgi:hypothetical protein